MPYINFINKVYIGHLLVVLDGGFINIVKITVEIELSDTYSDIH